jgi:putative ABC transport system permease protein
MRILWKDLRYGLRGWISSPGFALLAILTLALGIGAATTMFSVVKNVLISPFPYRDADRIVQVFIHDLDDSGFGGRPVFQGAEYLEFRNRNHVFSEDISSVTQDVLWTTPDGTEQWVGGQLSGNTFQCLGVPAQVGRILTPQDSKPGAPPVFVMSYKLWARRFQLDPSIVGRTFTLNGEPTTLVGIMGKRFTKRAADLWQPLDPTSGDDRYFLYQAYLRPGVSLKQVEADLTPIAVSWAKDHPKDYPKRYSVQAINYVDSVVGSFKKTLLTLAAAVALLLLIACANVANMLLARSTARDREMAIRSALGAGRWRIARQLLAENLLLGLGGAALGCVFAWGGIKALVAYIPEGAIPREAEITLDTKVLLFSLGLAIFTSLLFGLAPVWQLARRNIVDPLKDSGRGIGGGFRRARLRNTLVVVELALSIVLLGGAGLMIRTFAALQQQDLGFKPDNVLFARIPFPKGQYQTADEMKRFFAKLLPQVKTVPGVIDITAASTLPPYGGIRSKVEVPGRTHSEEWNVIYQLVSEGYLHTLSVPLTRGRNLGEGDIEAARRVAVINEAGATKFFEREDPIGRQLVLQIARERTGKPEPTSFEIVGIFHDMKNDDVNRAARPEILVPYTITGRFERGVMVRSVGNPAALVHSVEREIWKVDRNVAATMTRPLSDFLNDFTFSQPRFVLVVLGVFAGLGLVLVAVGVYSVIAYTVSRQTHEIGIRMALGALGGDIIRMVLRMGLWLMALGIAIGVGAALLVNRVLATELWGVKPHDPITLIAVSLVMLLVGILACWLPARRATNIDPSIALRFE